MVDIWVPGRMRPVHKDCFIAHDGSVYKLVTFEVRYPPAITEQFGIPLFPVYSNMHMFIWA